jgi:hypothetical protein
MRMDLKSAAVQVGKALNDPAVGLSMLTRVGITFSEAQKKVIKGFVESGQLAKAQIVILKELESQFGGSARAARETLPGALAGLKNAFGDLFEVTDEGSSNLIGSINRLTDTLSSAETRAAIQNFGAWLLDAISGALDAMKRLAYIWNQLKQGDFGFLNAGIATPEGRMNVAKRDLALGIGNRLSGGSANSFYDAVGMPGAAVKSGGANDDNSPSKEALKAAESYAKLVRGANEFIAAQKLEQQALGMSEQAANALRHEQELLNKAANDNIKLTAAQKTELHNLAGSMAATEAATSKAKEAFNFAKETFGGFFSDLRQGLKSGEGFWTSFGNAATNALNKIADRLIRMTVDNPWSSAFPGGFSSIFGGAGASRSTMGVSGLLPAIHHGGYGPGDSIKSARIISALAFANAPRFHTGIGPGERPAIIRDDESVLTPGQMRQLTPSGRGARNDNFTFAPNIIVHNAPAGTTAQVKQTRGANGQPNIEIILKRTMDDTGSALIDSGESAMNRSFERNYGLKRVV